MKRRVRIILFMTLLIFAFSTTAADAKGPSKYKWSEKAAPNYVVKIGRAKVSGKPAKGKIKYSKLDKYGRTKRAVGNITYAMVKRSAGSREEFSEGSDPAGWGVNRIVKIKLYNGRYYRGYLFNRSHLIADSLGGRAIRKNLITGTRTQNVGANDGTGGMAYTERKVVSYLYKHHKVSVYYSARPVYKGRELIPRSVIVDIRSSDKKLNERVIVYNAAKGHKIDYKKGMKGSSALSAKFPASGTVYITRTGKRYHLNKNCYGLRNAGSIYTTTKKKAEAKGLTPCAICGR